MPATLSYPGVYVEEIPSGVHTITGVATSITAFIGRALRGPVDDPIIINSFADFERSFGGLWVDGMLGYAVRDFYQNGGSQAVIVRVINGTLTALTATIELPTGGSPSGTILLDAYSPGAWGSNLSVLVDYNTADPMNPSAPVDPELFNLTITERVDGVTRSTEAFLGVSMNPNSRRNLPRVLGQRSQLLVVRKNASGNWNDVPTSRPQNNLPSGSPPVILPYSASTVTDGADIGTAQFEGSPSAKTGIYALAKTDLFNLLCIPPPVRGGDTAASVYQKAMKYCEDRRAMLIVDPPVAWGASPVTAVSNATSSTVGLGTLGLSGTSARNAALYFPHVVETDPNRDNQLDTFAPSGIVAGIMARTDTQRGVWKAPAGLDAAINGIQALQVNLNDAENGQLNPLGINCLRSFPINGRVVWGARTLRGADQLADEYKYVPVRRTALFIEESLYRGTQWVVFEPNDEPLWAQIRLNVGAFMQNLFRQGAFQGQTPREAYFVKCDKETTTQNDINLGIVNILVGFAPLKPAEFVIIKLQQIAGQIET
jgi:phage tail sheath protein FI